MPFEYPCFISYRHHEQSELAETFILDLYTALRNELILMVEPDLFLDRDRLRPGALYNPQLAHALCKSACMVVVYTPTYFSRTHLYCAREFRAMEALEQRRLARLPGQAARECGLIIPIVLRGANSLPATITAERQYYTFERFTLTSRKLAKNREFEKQIRAIAEAIYFRWELFAAIGDDLTCDCENFTLPSDAEIHEWLDTITQPVSPFPFRRG